MIKIVNQDQIRTFLEAHQLKKDRTIVIVDFGNVEKWKESLGWPIGVRELANLIKNFSSGKTYLRRFYYGSDYGQRESNTELVPWSKNMLETANMNGLEVVTKRVKYIHTSTTSDGFQKKCDLDVEMTVDLIRERDQYDTIVLFSGDGDLSYALRYLHDNFGKKTILFGARNHVAREMFDAHADGIITDICFAEDFEYRIKAQRRFR